MIEMIKPVKNGTITADFDQRRPLSVPEEDRSYNHDATDFGLIPRGTDIYAPESGTMFCWTAYRKEGDERWPELPVVHGKPFTFANYFYDIYGGIIVLQVHLDHNVIRTHIIAHTYANQIYNHLFKGEYSPTIEEKKDNRFAIHGQYTKKIEVKAGDKIGEVGNAGYSTGPHIHWEIHPGNRRYNHGERLNPEDYI